MKKALHKYFIPGEHNNFHPHILHSKRTIFYGLFFSSLKLLLFVFVLSLPAEVFVLPDVLAEERKQIIELTNELRMKNNLPILLVNNELSWSSQAKADDMASNKYFAHRRKKKTAADWLSAAGYDFEVAGENLAVGFKTPKEVVDAWINSPTHYLNLIDIDFVDIGVGLAGGIFNGEPAIYIAQHLGSPVDLSKIPNKDAAADSFSSEVALIRESEPGNSGSFGAVLGEKIKKISQAVPLALDTAGSTPVRKYLHAKQVLNPITDIFNITRYIFLTAMIFFTTALCLKVFIKFEHQHPRVIAETSVLILVLFIFWKF